MCLLRLPSRGVKLLGRTHCWAGEKRPTHPLPPEHTRPLTAASRWQRASTFLPGHRAEFQGLCPFLEKPIPERMTSYPGV